MDQWLQKESPDIVCMQELKALDASFPIADIRKAGYGIGPDRDPAQPAGRSFGWAKPLCRSRPHGLIAWFERLIEHAKGLYGSGHPVVFAGDYNVVPTDFDIYRRLLKQALDRRPAGAISRGVSLGSGS